MPKGGGWLPKNLDVPLALGAASRIRRARWNEVQALVELRESCQQIQSFHHFVGESVSEHVGANLMGIVISSRSAIPPVTPTLAVVGSPSYDLRELKPALRPNSESSPVS